MKADVRISCTIIMVSEVFRSRSSVLAEKTNIVCCILLEVIYHS